MTPPPLRRRRAKAKAVLAWAIYWPAIGHPFLSKIYSRRKQAKQMRDDHFPQCQIIRVEIREITTAPKRGRKKGKR